MHLIIIFTISFKIEMVPIIPDEPLTIIRLVDIQEDMSIPPQPPPSSRPPASTPAALPQVAATASPPPAPSSAQASPPNPLLPEPQENLIESSVDTEPVNEVMATPERFEELRTMTLDEPKDLPSPAPPEANAMAQVPTTPETRIASPDPRIETPSPQVTTPGPPMEVPAPLVETPAPQFTVPTPQVVVPTLQTTTPVPEREEEIIFRPEDYLPQSRISRLPVFSDDELRNAVIYPEQARRRGIEGEVTLELFIDRQGLVRQVTILREEPQGRGFGEAAVKAFQGRSCREPARGAGGNPINVRYRYPVRFKLN
jgi:protein TonB